MALSNTVRFESIAGKTDTVGGGQANLRLSRNRAMAVRQVMLATDNITPSRIERRWTSDRTPGSPPPITSPIPVAVLSTLVSIERNARRAIT